MLKIPLGGAEIQEVGGVKFLVSKLEEQKTCSEFISELRKGKPVVVPWSKRSHMVGSLKKESVFTRSKTLVTGQWVTFIPCEEREFRP